MSSRGVTAGMSANAVAASQTREPAGMVLVGGQQVPFISWEVANNGFFQADTFGCELPMSALPFGQSAAFLADQTSIAVEIRLSVDGTNPTSLITGAVDDLDIDWPQQTLSLTGRDYSSQLIETKTSLTWRNQVSSAIVQQLAAAHGLTANAHASSTYVGRYYETDHDKLGDDVTEWSLVQYLAQKEGYYAWVSGSTLNFQPLGAAQGSPLQVQWKPAGAGTAAQAPLVSLKTSRKLMLAKGVKVIVWSWNHKKKTAFKATAGSGAETYSFRVPGLEMSDAQQLAQTRLEQISRHEKKLELEMVADVTTNARQAVQLSGTGTGFDQIYYVEEVRRSMRFGELMQSLRAKNVDPSNEGPAAP